MSREQVLEFGSVRLEKSDEDEALYFLAGEKLYVVGAQSGQYPALGWRRTGFIVGKRLEERRERAAHLVNEMGGIWIQPIKVLDGFHFNIDEDGAAESWELRESAAFVNHFSHAAFLFERDGLEVSRRDFVVEGQPALYSTLTLRNNRQVPVRFLLHLTAQINLMPAWFAGWGKGRDEVSYEDGVVTACDSRWRERWAVAFGANRQPSAHQVREVDGRKRSATLTYPVALAPGAQEEITFLFTGENKQGLLAARQRYARLQGKQEAQLRKKIAKYRKAVFDGVKFECSDQELVTAYYCAKANLQLLHTDLLPSPGCYFFAGIPEYVQLFGTDTCYSVPGILAANLRPAARDALMALARYAGQQCGRVPHEVTTTGRIFHPGNPQETPQFAIACWNYFRWTGDRAFLSQVYDLCEEGLLDYLVAFWDADLDFYPNGQSMIERHGADEENVDAVCYFTKALTCLADMADVLGYHESARRYRDEYADVLRVSLNHDFWMDDQSIFADSLAADHTKRLDGYWTVVVPLETDLADPDKAERTMATIASQEGWLSEYGLVHTRGKESLVWTLPTGILARIAFNWGIADLGVRQLKNIASTIKYGMLGAFEELIPEGLSFVQLWSPAVFLQGITEGLFGLNPSVHRDRLELFPCPPAEWTFAKLEGILVGDRELSIGWERRDGDQVRIAQHRGPRMTYALRWFVDREVQPLLRGGSDVTIATEKKGEREVVRVEFALEQGESVEIVLAAPSGTHG